MSKQENLKYSPDVLLYPLLFVMVLWIVFWIESRFGINLNRFGIYPRDVEGLRGILFSPFIHGSLEHLFNNSVPLFVLTAALFYFYRPIRWRVLLFGLLITGLATWVIGRPSMHIGASGIVYMLVAFLFFKGIFSKQYQLTALALGVVFLYGGLWWYVFPIDPKISWEGHLSGFFVGILFAFLFKANPVENKKYDWEQPNFNPDDDPFLRQFDENGNFIEPPKQEDLPENNSESDTEVPSPSPKRIRIVYHHRKNTDNK